PTEPRYMTGAGPNVPNVIGQGENTAQLTLERSGFRVRRVVGASDQPAGLVAAESPTTAQPGDMITITVSDGSGGSGPRVAPNSPPPAPPYRPPNRRDRDQRPDAGNQDRDNGPAERFDR
ncbi:MAG TPA: PASTA domain-containing protein, partial [Pseudonocardiaceae bacterium]|nr:PASTA domain-containing protein [Pseudonocardiaceae bacterium]